MNGYAHRSHTNTNIVHILPRSRFMNRSFSFMKKPYLPLSYSSSLAENGFIRLTDCSWLLTIQNLLIQVSVRVRGSRRLPIRSVITSEAVMMGTLTTPTSLSLATLWSLNPLFNPILDGKKIRTVSEQSLGPHFHLVIYSSRYSLLIIIS